MSLVLLLPPIFIMWKLWNLTLVILAHKIIFSTTVLFCRTNILQTPNYYLKQLNTHLNLFHRHFPETYEYCFTVFVSSVKIKQWTVIRCNLAIKWKIMCFSTTLNWFLSNAVCNLNVKMLILIHCQREYLWGWFYSEWGIA